MNPPPGHALTRAASWLGARRHGVAASCLAALTLLLYRDALSRWWFADDPLHLQEAIRYSPGEYLFVPEVWQELVGAFFTPLITLSYDLDYTLFGLDPRPFFAHQLASMALAAVAFYVLLTLWVPRTFALAGAVLLLLTTPFALASAWLAIRHYVEGLAFASLALYAWVVALRRQSAGWRWTAAALYLLAMMAKEVYLPLVALMVMVPEGAWRERARASLPSWTVLAAFLLWRFWMLGGSFGGYGLWSPDWQLVPVMALLALVWLPVTIFWNLFGGGWMAALFLGLFVAILMSQVRRPRLNRLGLMIAVLVSFTAPLLPIVGDVPPDGPLYTHRVLMAPAAGIVFALTLGLARLGPDGARRILALLLMAMTGIAFWWQSHSMLANWHDPARMRQEGAFLLEKPTETHMLAIPDQASDCFYRGAHWLRGHLGHGRAPATVYGGFFGLGPGYGGLRPNQRIYRYEQHCGCLGDVTNEVLREREALLRRMVHRPLRADLRWGHGRLSWSLGPYEEGRYFLLAGQTPDHYLIQREVGREGTLAFLMEGYMRVGYASPEGWVTFSPEFHVRLASRGQFEAGTAQPGG